MSRNRHEPEGQARPLVRLREQRRRPHRRPGIFNPTTDGAGSTTRFDAGVYIIGSAGNKWIGGTWAATAPLGPAPRVVPSARRLNR
jgi:hypothetical protein